MQSYKRIKKIWLVLLLLSSLTGFSPRTLLAQAPAPLRQPAVCRSRRILVFAHPRSFIISLLLLPAVPFVSKENKNAKDVAYSGIVVCDI